MRKLQVLLIFLSCFGVGGASADDAGRTVALLLAVPEVTSLAELAGKNIAIDEAAAAANDEARRKVEAAVNAKLAEGRAKALDRLVNGEVRAAVADAGLSGDGRVVRRNRGFQGISNSADGSPSGGRSGAGGTRGTR